MNLHDYEQACRNSFDALEAYLETGNVDDFAAYLKAFNHQEQTGIALLDQRSPTNTKNEKLRMKWV